MRVTDAVKETDVSSVSPSSERRGRIITLETSVSSTASITLINTQLTRQVELGLGFFLINSSSNTNTLSIYVGSLSCVS